MTRLFFSLLFLSVLSACANVDFGSPNTYQRADVQHTGTVQQANVVRVRNVTIQASSGNPALTSLVSAGVGAFLSSRVVGNGSGRYIAAAVGGAGSGFVGQAISQTLSRHAGLEIVVHTDAGRTLVVSQPDDQAFAPGERVLLVSNGSGVRVTH
jgi:outer membrane lipoprotein SlyB